MNQRLRLPPVDPASTAGSAHGWHAMMLRDSLAYFRCLTPTNESEENPPAAIVSPVSSHFLHPQGPQGQTGSPGGVGPKGRRVSGAVGSTLNLLAKVPE